jgi:hypothetical protein
MQKRDKIKCNQAFNSNNWKIIPGNFFFRNWAGTQLNPKFLKGIGFTGNYSCDYLKSPFNSANSML